MNEQGLEEKDLKGLCKSHGGGFLGVVVFWLDDKERICSELLKSEKLEPQGGGVPESESEHVEKEAGVHVSDKVDDTSPLPNVLPGEKEEHE